MHFIIEFINPFCSLIFFQTECVFIQARYRISKSSFEDLAEIIKPYYYFYEDENGKRKKRRSDIIPLNIALSMTLRWLSGGSYLDIVDLHGVCETSFYAAKESVMFALQKGLKREVSWPKSEEDRVKVAQRFSENSGGVMRGCLSALDGLAVEIKEPTVEECGGNPVGYRNRKGFFAILVQATCNADCEFTFFDASFQGSCHDSTAFESTELALNIDTMVPGIYWIAADDAYTCCEQVVTPFPGKHGANTIEDAFNFWLSGAQRIFIE